MAAGLRERRRQETGEAILAAARRLLAEEGQAGLTLRAVAREVGVAVSALYRYVPSRDHLVTELLAEAFEQHADALDAAVQGAVAAGGGSLDRPGPAAPAGLRAGLHAYRDWAVAHPVQFGLAYGAPLPGFAAPAERTVAAATRPGDRLAALLAAAHAEGLVDPAVVARRAAALDGATADQLGGLAGRRHYDLPVPLLALMIDAFVRVHGFVVMEVFGQLRPITPEAGGYFAGTVEEVLASLGLPPSSTG